MKNIITMKSARCEFAGRSYKIRKRPVTLPAHVDDEGNKVPAATTMLDVKVRTRSSLGKEGFRTWARQRYAGAGAGIGTEVLSPKLASIVGGQ